jgi:predicted enzyme related to lactoylglutathione lyase
MGDQHGDFIWYELLTTEPDAAAHFYSAVVGWSFVDSGMSGGDYRFFSYADKGIGGMLHITPADCEKGARPCWLGYIGVTDVDATTASIRDAGGTVLIPPTDIPDVGRFALLTDPQGHPFYVMRGTSSEASPSFSENAIGHCVWNELNARDHKALLPFYSTQFGWQPGEAMDMGPMGEYRFFTQNGITLGAMMTVIPGAQAPQWAYYFMVADIDIAASHITAEGGEILEGPSEVPGNLYMVRGMDPQGAEFAIVGARHDQRAVHNGEEQ